MSNRIILAAGALVTVIGGLSMFLGATAAGLHADPPSVPAVTHSAPPAQWSGPVERARQVVRAGLAEQNLPGVSVAVGMGNDIVWAEGFGWADLAQDVRVTPDHRFWIGTTSMALTSAAVGVLLEQGRLNLDDEIQTYVPGFPSKAWPVTVRQVMGHVAGLTSESADDRPISRHRCERPIEALRHFADAELLFQPGTQYRHSTYGWILASAAVEAAAGEPFMTFMRERIFQPLGMDDTGAESATEENPEGVGEAGEDPPPFTLIRGLVLEPLGIASPRPMSATRNMATFYAPGWGPRPIIRHGLHVMAPRNLSCYAGSKAFFSTPSDLVRFGLAMNSGTVLQPATVQLLQTPQPLTSGERTGYGLGWDVETVTLGGKPTQAVGHDGELPGGKASLRTFPEHGIVLAVTSNASYADTSALALKIAETFADPSTTGIR